jgi:hypothetical protein
VAVKSQRSWRRGDSAVLFSNEIGLFALLPLLFLLALAARRRGEAVPVSIRRRRTTDLD